MGNLPARSNTNLQAHLDLLVCPVCHGSLRLMEGEIECSGCGRIYPIVDELPVLIPTRAKTRDQIAG